MKKENDNFETLKGIVAGIITFSCIIGFMVFMFWICMKIFGWEL